MGTYLGGVDLSAEKIVSVRTIRGLSLTDRSLQDINAAQYQILTYKTVFTGGLTLRVNLASSIRTTPIVANYYNTTFNNQSLTNLISTGLGSVSSTSYSTVTVGPPNIYMPSNGNLGTYTNGAILPATGVTAVTNDSGITYSYTGTLPTGLIIDANSGSIIGTASFTGTTSTTYNFTVTAATTSQTVSAAFNVTFNPSEPNFNYNAMVVHADGPPTTVTTGVFTGSISGTTLNISAVTNGWLGPGSLLVGTNILANTYITAMGSGSYGSLGTYTVSVSQTVATTVISAQGAVNNSIIQDLSPYNNSIQRNVNHGTGTFSPFSHPAGYWSTAFGITGGSASIQTPNVTTMTYGYSGVFNGSTQYLTVADNALLQMGSGDFTIETWYLQNNVTGIQTIYDKGYQTAGSLLIQTAPGSGLLMINTGTTQGYSAIFNGTSNYLITTANSLTTENFTFECFFFLTSNLTYLDPGQYSARIITGTVAGGVEFWVLSASTSTNIPSKLQFNDAGGTRIIFVVPNLYIPIGVWNHVAATKNGTNWAIWLNGTRVGLLSNTTANFVASAIYIGGYASGGSYISYFPGYISNLRIVKAVVYDTSLGNITVPTSTLTNIANTYLLTCHAATFVDGSSNGFTVTPTGSTVATLPNPFMTFTEPATQSFNIVPITTWQHIAVTRSGSNFRVFRNGGQVGSTLTNSTNFNSTVLMSIAAGLTSGTGTTPGVYFNGYISAFRILKGSAVYTNNFLSPYVPFVNSGSSIITVPATSYSMSFNGSSQYLKIPSNAALDFGTTTDFTIETWIYPTTLTPGGGGTSNGIAFIAGYGSNPSIPTGYFFGISGNYLYCSSYVAGTQQSLTATTTPITINTWQHVAVTRSGSTYRIFLNGLSLPFTGSITQAFSTNGSSLNIGGLVYTTYYDYFTGYISNFRIVKGTALYTTNFSTPTSVLTNIQGTSLLLLPGSSIPITDSSNNIVPFSYTSPGTYYGSFNGSNQYLSIPSSAALDIWTTSSSATLELWYYSTSATQIGHLFIMGPSGTNRVYLISQGSSLSLGTAISGTFTTRITSGVSVVQNTWYHVAISRVGATYTLYVNGNNQGSSSLALYNNGGNGVPLYIGVQAYSPLAADWFNGYISNFRIVNGGALYTQNFTPSGPLTTTVSSGTVSLLALQSASATTDTAGLNTISNPNSIAMSVSGIINNSSVTISNSITPTLYTTASSGGSGTLIACQNATITFDQSSNTFTITNNGAATVSTTITPFLTGNHLVITTDDYTIEGFAMRNTISTSNVIASHGGYDGLRNFSLLRLNNGLYGTWGNGYQFFVVPGSTTTDDKLFGYPGKWFHFAISRSNGQAYFHINGIQVGAVYDSSYINLNNMYIGNNIGTASLEWTGHISNFRVTKGSAIYAYNSTFTPPVSPLTKNTNTLLLACSSMHYLEDRSGRKIVLTRNNAVSASPFTPFTSYTNGVDKTYSPTTVSGSMSFNGSNEFVYVPDATQFNFSTGKPWTIEYWIWPSGDYTQSRTMFAKRVGNSVDISIQGYLRLTSGVFGIIIGYGGGSGNITAGQSETTTTPQPHAWSHVAYVYDGASGASIYLNGVKIFFASGFIPYNSSTTFTIGALNNGSEYFQGYISNFRILNGTGLYSSTQNTVNTILFGTYTGGSFTTPSAPLTAITDTVLLITNANNAGYDTAGRNNYYFYTGAGGSTAGTAVSSAVTYLGAKSLRFNGSNDWFASAQIYNIAGFNNPIFYFGTGDWTVEFWVYFSVVTGNQTLIDFRPSGTASTANYIVLQLISGVLNYYTATILAIAGPTLVATTWYHVSLSRQFGKTRLFVNGVQQGQDYTDTQTYTVGLSRPVFGCDYSTANFMNGYMDEIRITRYARYAGQFTAPTAELPDTSTGDTDFIHNNLLVHGNGNNTQTNNTFVDTTGNNSFVRTGTPSQGTFTPFSRAAGYWSNHFNGGTDFLTVSNGGNDTTSLTLVSGNWTIEGWLLEGSSTRLNPLIIGNYFTTANYSNNKWGIFFSTSASRGSFVMTAYNSGFTISSGTTYVNVGKWNHFAFVRNTNTLSIYVNGNLANSANYAANIDNGTAGKFFIGDAGGDPTTFFNGYISNLRVVKGVAVYTGAFTPPTSPLAATQSSGTNIAAISGTSTLLLTCQNYNFVDNSTNTWFVIPTGNISTQITQPFAISSAYSTSTNGGSLMFYGTPDYLTTNATQILPSNGIFTIQCWVYPTIPYANDQMIFSQGTTAPTGFQLYIQAASNSLAVWYNNTIVTSTKTIQINVWTHVAVTSSGSTVAFYINGVAYGSSALAVAPPNNVGIIGDDWNHTLYGFIGHISNLKIDNSVLSISLPTAPFTSATKMLLLGTNGGMIDNVSKYDLVTVGSTQLSTINKKYGTGSMFFNGTTDYISVGPTFNSWFPSNTQLTTTSQGALPTQVVVLTCQTSAIIDNGTGSGSIPQPTYIPTATYGGYFSGSSNYLTLPLNGNPFEWTTGVNWTFECWVYPLSRAIQVDLFARGTPTGTTTDWALNILTSGAFSIYNLGQGSLATTSTLISLNAWTHLAAVITSNQVILYINGVASTTSTAISAASTGAGSTLYFINGLNARYSNIYISNLRIVKGTAVYTGAFTPVGPLNRIQSSSTNISALTGTETVLLTLQNNTIVDNSIAYGGSGIAIANSNPPVNVVTFPTGSGYAITNTGTVSSTNIYIPFSGTYSYSFNGSTQNLVLSTFTPFQTTATAPFTIECWVYNTAFTGCVVASNIYVSGTIPYVIGFNDGTNIGGIGGYPYYGTYNGSAWTLLNTTLLCVINTWYHFAVSYDGTTLRLFINGSVIGSLVTATPSQTSAGTTGYYIGRRWDGGGNNFFAGYISNFRFTKGSALYTGTTSMLPVPVQHTSPFTIECWIYITSYSTMTIYSQFSLTTPDRFWFGIDNSLGYKLVLFHGRFGATFGNTAVPLNQWNHVAVTRDTLNRLLIHLNGALDGSAANFTNGMYQASARIGNLSNSTNYFSGYIDDLRISLFPRYTSNFTVPTKYLDQ